MFDRVHQTVVDLKEGLQSTRLRTKEPMLAPKGGGKECRRVLVAEPFPPQQTHIFPRTDAHTRTVDAHGRLHLYRETATRTAIKRLPRCLGAVGATMGQT